MDFFGLEIKRKNKQPQQLTQDDIKSVIYASINDIVSLWEITDDRKTVYSDIDRMASSDEYVAEALDVLTSDILPIRNFYDPLIDIDCKEENLKKKIKQIIALSGLKSGQKLRNIVYNYLKYHNAWTEFLVASNKKFAGLHFIPQAWSMYRNVDIHGLLKSGDPDKKKIDFSAYDQRSDTGSFIAGFYPYQIIHFVGTPQTKEGQGIPFLQSARKNWLRLQVSEDSVAIARIVRAYLKLIHFVPVGDEATNEDIDKAIESYKDSMTKKQLTSMTDSVLKKSKVNYPHNANTDFFLPKNATMQGDIKTIDPSNSQLTNLSDMEYALNRLFARLKVPKSRLANEKDVRAKATMIEINTAYASTIIGMQIDVLHPIVETVNRALFLDGYDLDRVEYKLMLPSPFIKDEKTRAEIDKIESETARNYTQSKVLSRDTIRQMNLGMDEKESEAEQEKVIDDMEIFPDVKAGGVNASQVPTDELVLEQLYQLRKDIGNNGNSECRDYEKVFDRK